MWILGVACGVFVVLLKILYDVTKGVGSPTYNIKKDAHLWTLVQKHKCADELVRELDKLVLSVIETKPFTNWRDLDFMLLDVHPELKHAVQQIRNFQES